MTWQDDAFTDRLMRLHQSSAKRQQDMATRAAQFSNGLDHGASELKRQLSILSAAMIGFLSVPLLRYAMFHSQGIPNTTSHPHLVVMIDAIFAFCIAYCMARVLFRGMSRKHMIAQVAGIWCALIGMHNFVHAYPDTWASAFSDEWVDRVLQMTEPNSLYLLGTTFP